jgi:broad specificity phosphatase PhoE
MIGSLISDPKLTAEGLAEANALRGRIPPPGTPIDLICSSPMRRTLLTTMALFGDQIMMTPLPVAMPVQQPSTTAVAPSTLVAATTLAPLPTSSTTITATTTMTTTTNVNDTKVSSSTTTITATTKTSKLPLLLISEAQEIHPIPCDTGSPITKLVQWFPTLNFSGLAADWYVKKGINSPLQLSNRVLALVERLWYQVVVGGHRNMVLVGHHGIFLKATGIVSHKLIFFPFEHISSYLFGVRRYRCGV